MADDKERLIVQLEARINDFEKRMKKAERTGTRSFTNLRRGSNSATRAMEADMVRSSSSINKALAATSARIGTFGRAMAAGFAGGVVTAALAGISTNLTAVVKGIAEVGNEAKRSGLSAQAFQEWKFVAEQNRIGVDQLVDGFKELNLRADEFIVTGKGPAAEAFKRLNLSAKSLERGLEDPSELMLEIIGRLEDMDKAAQIRIADEVFGGSAGERFVELLGRGETGLRHTISRAHELGAVMDDEMIARADELDRKFQRLQTRLSSVAKGIAVAIADAFSGPDVEDLFRGDARARAVLGDAVAEAFGESTEMVGQYRENIDDLAQSYGDLEEAVLTATNAMAQEVPALLEIDELDLAMELADIASEASHLVERFRNGEVQAGEFEAGLVDLVERADDTVTALEAIDTVDFSYVVGAIGRISSALSGAIERASTLRTTLPGASEDVTFSTGPTSRVGKRATSDLAPTSTMRPRSSPPMTHELGYESGGGGGGGSSRLGDYAREVEQIRQLTSSLQAEAAALAAVSVSGGDYASAMDLARKKAELLHAAQREGKDITPELRAEIDALAEGYINAGNAADAATERLENMQDAAERGADALTDVFQSVFDGSMTAMDAVQSLLLQIAKVQIAKQVAGLTESSGIGAFLGDLLSYDGGGFTGSGARSGGVDGKGGFPAILHPNETVIDHTKRGSGANTTVVYSPTIHAPGATVEAINAIAKVIAEDKRNFAPNVRKIMNTPQLAGRG